MLVHPFLDMILALPCIESYGKFRTKQEHSTTKLEYLTISYYKGSPKETLSQILNQKRRSAVGDF